MCLTLLGSLDKDVFLRYFQRALAKRLLLQRSADDDFEREFLKKLGEGTHALLLIQLCLC